MPVFNEQAALERSIRRLHRFLSAELPVSWRIVIADNASTDATPAIAAALAHELPGVEVLRLDRKGRGLALREAWSRSDARVLCYMDVDLSTDLRGLLPLVAPLLSGHSDVAIGTRLARSARVVRGAQARGHLALLQPPAAHRAARALLRRAVRLQGRDGDGGPAPAGRGPRRRLVLRHRAARARPAHRAAHPRGPGRLGRRPRLARRHREHRDRGPARRRAPGGRRPRGALHGRRRAQHDRLRRALPAAARDARRRRGERRRPRADRGGQHGRQPAPDLRRARTRAAPAPSRARSRRLRPHAGADDARAGQPAPHRSLAVARGRAGGARRRGRRGDRHPLPGPAHVGLRPRAGGRDGSPPKRPC